MKELTKENMKEFIEAKRSELEALQAEIIEKQEGIKIDMQLHKKSSNEYKELKAEYDMLDVTFFKNSGKKRMLRNIEKEFNL